MLAEDAKKQLETLAKDRLPTTTRVANRWKREVEIIAQMMRVGEEPRQLAYGELEDEEGLIVATNERILFAAAKGVKDSITRDVPLRDVRSVEAEIGTLGGGEITLKGTNLDVELEDLKPRGAAEELAAYVRQNAGGRV